MKTMNKKTSAVERSSFPIGYRAIIIAALCTIGTLALPAFAQTGGTFDLTWSTIDSGGGISTGGVFSLHGTVGQADAGELTGGTYALSGGFWSVAVPGGMTPNPPTPSTSKLNRYLLFTDTNGGNPVAYRVDEPGMAAPKYVQLPGTGGAPPGISRLGCTPAYIDWSNGEIRVGDADVQPGNGVPRSYTIEATFDGLNFSAGVVVQTVSRWCDTNNTGTVSNFDILGVLNGFQGVFTTPNAIPPRKETVDFRNATGPASGVPDSPDFSVGNGDIIQVLNAFQGALYPFTFAPGC